uniref:Sulfhydryl oxidase n=1 Tax=Rhinella marina erythrocytic-like virus TaxID=2859906 RepID=A0A8F6YI67_9VIRU|nr:ERV1/Air family protein [Rhinella marina erythrocytic-like virus]
MAIPLKQTIVHGDCFTFPVRSPKAFGPSMWFTLHNGAANYPNTPTIEQMELMKGFIRGLPLMIPCVMCKIHFQSIVNNTDLDTVVKSKELLFLFFFQAHNIVNKKLNKPLITLAQAKKMYAFHGETGSIMIQITKTKEC